MQRSLTVLACYVWIRHNTINRSSSVYSFGTDGDGRASRWALESMRFRRFAEVHETRFSAWAGQAFPPSVAALA